MRILIATSYGFNPRMRNFIEFTVARLLARKGWDVTAFAEPEGGRDEFYATDKIRVFKVSNILKKFLLLLKNFYLKNRILSMFLICGTTIPALSLACYAKFSESLACLRNTDYCMIIIL